MSLWLVYLRKYWVAEAASTLKQRRIAAAVYSAVFLVVVAILSYQLWLPSLFHYLDVSQTPQPADAIVILGGGDGRREQYAAQIYHEGYGSRVLISGHADHMDYYLNSLLEQAVPEDVVIINDEATSTYDESEQVLTFLREMGAESALIVTDRFHTRRASATYRHVFRNSDIEVTFISPDESFDPSVWWKSNHSSQILMEYPKMLYYWLIYGVWSG